MIAKALPSFYEAYDSFSYAVGLNHYIEAIEKYAPHVDLFHCHNEPSWFVTMIKERCDKPVVLDVHDSYLARMTPEEELEQRDRGNFVFRVQTEERNNFQLADALVFPSRPFANIILNEFALEQPHLILPSYLPLTFYQYKTDGWLGGLVYQGRVDLKSKIAKNPDLRGFRYSDYEELAHSAAKAGVDFHIYGPITSNEEFQKLYQSVAFLHEGRVYDKLIPAISRHDWGLIGNIFHTPEWEVAFPNKLFDYMGALVPTVAINAKHSSEFIEEHGIGITVESIEELRDRWREHRECRKQLVKVRQHFIMDNHIHKLEQLYKCLLG